MTESFEIASSRWPSPLRYPGGKGSFSQLLEKAILRNKLAVPVYYEPFAGGAGAALKLLYAGKVSRLALNDADRRIYCFWKSALTESERFAEKIAEIPLSIPQWKFQKSVSAAPDSHDDFDVGFSTFYLNRCNRSGVIGGAGPIGGYDQCSTYTMDARFNRESLAARILQVGKHSEQVTIDNLDALRFLKDKLPKGNERKKVLAYIDPPYFKQGRRLYLNYYKDKDHDSLGSYLRSQRTLPWIVSYDDCPEIRSIYSDCNIKKIKTWYSLQVRGQENELLIYPKHLSIPRSS